MTDTPTHTLTAWAYSGPPDYNTQAVCTCGWRSNWHRTQEGPTYEWRQHAPNHGFLPDE